jgi:hypothetical protein
LTRIENNNFNKGVRKMKPTMKISLVLLSMLFFTGLTACDQAEKVIDDAAESAKQTVDTAKDKVAEILGTTEEKDAAENSKEESAEPDEGEEEQEKQ